jgi:hypothetical protein
MKKVLKMLLLLGCVIGGYTVCMVIIDLNQPYVLLKNRNSIISPSITYDSYNNLYLCYSERYSVIFQRQLNESDNFESPQELFSFYGAYTIETQITRDSENTIYVTAGNGTHMFLTSSSDQGNSWSSPKVIIELGAISNLFHDCAIDSANHLFIAYDVNFEVVLRNSSDQGQTWSAPRSVGSFYYFSIAFNTSDNLLFVGSNDATSLIYMKSSDWGYNWTTPQMIINNIYLNKCPILKSSEENETYLFYTNVGHNSHLSYMRFENESKWADPSIIYQGTRSIEGYGADLSSKGKIVVVWCENKYSSFFSYRGIIYSYGLPENYFTGYYLAPFFIGLLIASGIYFGIVLVVIHIRKRQVGEKILG